MNNIVNPRLTDVLDLPLDQSQLDFAIPHLKEDIPLYLDPFLLWNSSKSEYRRLHEQLVGFFEHLRDLIQMGKRGESVSLLAECGEPRELGLGYALGSKAGSALGPTLEQALLDALAGVPRLRDYPIAHMESLSLVVHGIAEDRVSDLTASILKHFLVEFTRARAERFQFPVKRFHLAAVFDHEHKIWRPLRDVKLPFSPLDGTPLLFAPLDLLRHLPWINYEDFYRTTYASLVLPPSRRGARRVSKEAVLAYNRAHFEQVQRYVAEREAAAALCKPDPLFQPLQKATLRKKIADLRKLPTGREDGNDKQYEDLAYDLLSSLLYPELEFAANQVRTVSGAHIRDVIFYNDGKTGFLKDVRDRFEARQVVFELKNVKALSGEHVNQLYRYLDYEFGRFGVLVTRNPLPSAVRTNIVDLHSSKRAAILWLDDSDFELMIELLDSGRRPIEALKKRFLEFTRLLPK
jgi:hypothetical protein